MLIEKCISNDIPGCKNSSTRLRVAGALIWCLQNSSGDHAMDSANWLSKSCKIILLAAVILPAIEPLATPAQAQGLDLWNKPCLKALKKWKTLAPHKAFAVSNSNAGGGTGQACGYTWSAPTKSAAEKGAVKSCEGEKTYRSGRCYVTKSE